jgi:predicted transposase YdaD
MLISNHSFIWNNRTPTVFANRVPRPTLSPDSFYDEGFQDGYSHGRIHGLIEGRALGREKGYEMFEELGYYEGFALTWQNIYEKNGQAEE